MVDSDRIISYTVLGFLGLVVLAMLLIGYCARQRGIRPIGIPGFEVDDISVEHGQLPPMPPRKAETEV